MSEDQIDTQNISVDSEEAADNLLETIERPSHEPIQEAQPQVIDEFELPIEDKRSIKVKREQLFQWAQQGRTAPGKISQLSKEVESWKSKYSESEPKWKEIETKYGEIDQYVRQNPAFWDHVQNSWKQRGDALSDSSNPLAGTVAQLQSHVEDLIQYKNQIEEQQQNIRAAKEDQDYLQTFEELQKQHSDIDFVTPDQEGKTLEYRVLEHAQANGIKNFKTAFRDYYHDELMKRSESRAKESFARDKQKNTKLGILGITTQPTKRGSSDVRGKSYDNIADEIKEEYGL